MPAETSTRLRHEMDATRRPSGDDERCRGLHKVLCGGDAVGVNCSNRHGEGLAELQEMSSGAGAISAAWIYPGATSQTESRHAYLKDDIGVQPSA